jgi:HNH endonuclease
MSERKKVPHNVTVAVLTEAGYRCAVPTCRTILAIDLHHMVEVAEGGGNEPSNLLALCPTCHALFHRGEIHRDSIYTWKSVLISLSQAFDLAALDQLLFLYRPEAANLRVSGDGVLQFSRLVAAGLATFQLVLANGPLLLYSVTLTPRGVLLISAWLRGDRKAVGEALG